MHTRPIVLLLLALAMTVVMGASAEPAAAITYGEPDGAAHPNVGAIIAEVPAGYYSGGQYFDGGKVVVASGSLIAPKVFLTAGHVPAILESLGITQVWVTFDSEFVRDRSRLIPGTMHANPGYRWVASDPNDIAVITFDRAIKGIPFAKLPAANLLGQMMAEHSLAGQTFTTVGYGMQEASLGGGRPVFGPSGTRRFVTSAFNALTPAYLMLCANPALDCGGSNYSDSGGPVIIDSLGVTAAVCSRGDPMARALNSDCRLDTPAARAYLSQYVTLP